jgi:hypothetical protein
LWLYLSRSENYDVRGDTAFLFNAVGVSVWFDCAAHADENQRASD